MCVCVWLGCGCGFGHPITTSFITHIIFTISCDPKPRTHHHHKEQRLQSSTTTTSSSSSYYLSAPSPPSMASRSGGGTAQRKRNPLGLGSSTADRMPSRWYTVLALPFPDQRLGRRDINTFGQGSINNATRAGYFSNQDR